MLTTFLNLHSQFSRVVYEKFSGVLQVLKDDGPSSSPNVFFPDGPTRVSSTLRGPTSPTVSPHRPSPSPPNTGMQYSPFGSTNTSPHQLIQQQLFFQQQQQQQMVLQQQLLQMTQQQFVQMKPPSVDGSAKEEVGSRHSSGGSSLGYGSWNVSSGGTNQHHQPSSPNFNNGNTLSPGVLSNYSGVKF